MRERDEASLAIDMKLSKLSESGDELLGQLQVGGLRLESLNAEIGHRNIELLRKDSQIEKLNDDILNLRKNLESNQLKVGGKRIESLTAEISLRNSELLRRDSQIEKLNDEILNLRKNLESKKETDGKSVDGAER